MNIDLDTGTPPSPERTLHLAAAMEQIARTLCHQTRDHAALDAPSDAERYLRSLQAVAGCFPQLVGQAAGWIRREQAAGRIEVTCGDYAGSSARAAVAVMMRLDAADTAAGELREDLEAAASVTATMSGTADPEEARTE